MVLIIETIVKVLKACVSPMALFILSLTILFVYIFKAGTNYLNIKKIFKDYISIFSDARKHLWLFWGVPVLLSTALVQVTVLTSELAEHLSVFLSILISAFFAMLSILVSKDTSKQTGKLYEQVLKETASTVLLEIVLCMMSLIISLAIIFLPDSIKCWAQIIISIRIADKYFFDNAELLLPSIKDAAGGLLEDGVNAWLTQIYNLTPKTHKDRGVARSGYDAKELNGALREKMNVISGIHKETCVDCGALLSKGKEGFDFSLFDEEYNIVKLRNAFVGNPGRYDGEEILKTINKRVFKPSGDTYSKCEWREEIASLGGTLGRC